MTAALALVGYQGVHVNDASITFDRPGMSVTLDGIAKGYIVDRTVAAMVETGAERVTVDAGALDQLLHPTIDPAAEKEVLARGLPASPGALSRKQHAF